MWNTLGGELDWAAVPWLAEMYGCDDLDALVDLLMTAREHLREDNPDT